MVTVVCVRVVTVVREKEVTVLQQLNCVCYMGVFKNVPNSRAVVVTLFDSDWLLCILMMLHYKSMVSSSYNRCQLHQWSVL